MLERIERDGVSLLLFPASDLGLYLDGQGGSNATPHSPDDALERSGAMAALDGPMFTACDGSEPPREGYARYQCGTVHYRHLDRAAGIDTPSLHPSRGLTISVAGGQASAALGDQPAPSADVAVQLYPALVYQGEVQRTVATVYNHVAALAVMRDGRLAMAVGRSMSMPTLAQRLIEAGALYAGYTDGGGSAALITPTQYAGSGEHRRVVTWLVVRPVSTSTPAGTAMAGVGLLAAVVGAWWLWRKR